MKKLRTLRIILAVMLAACMIQGTVPVLADGEPQEVGRVSLKTEDGRELLIVTTKEDPGLSNVNVEVFILPENEGEEPVPFTFTEEDAGLKDKIVEAIGKDKDDVYFVRNGVVSVVVTPEGEDKAALEITAGDVHSEIPPIPDANASADGIFVSAGEELSIELDGYENLPDEIDEELEENQYPFVDKVTVNTDTVTEEMAFTPAVPPEGDSWYAPRVEGIEVHTNQRDLTVNAGDIAVTAQNGEPEQPEAGDKYQFVTSNVEAEGISANITSGNAALSAENIEVDILYKETDPELDDYAGITGNGVDLYVAERLYMDEEPGEETFTAAVGTKDITVTGDTEGKEISLDLTGISSQAGVNGNAEITAGDVSVEGKTDSENAEVQLVGIRSETNPQGETYIEAGNVNVDLAAAGGSVNARETAIQVTVSSETEETDKTGNGEGGTAAQAEVTAENLTVKAEPKAENSEVILTGIGAQIGPDTRAEITSGTVEITAEADSVIADGAVIGLEGGSGTLVVSDITETVTAAGEAQAAGFRFDMEDAELTAKVEGSITEKIQAADGVSAQGVEGNAAGSDLGLAAGDVNIGITLTGEAEEPEGKESGEGGEGGEGGDPAGYDEGSFAYVDAGGVSLEMYGTDAEASVGNVTVEVTTEKEYDGLDLTLSGVEFNSYREQGQEEAESEVTIGVKNVAVSAEVKTDEIDTNISGLNIAAGADTATKVTAEDVTVEITASTGDKADDYYEHIPSALAEGIRATGEGTSVEAQDVSVGAEVKDGSFDAYAIGAIADGGATVEADSVKVNAASEGGEAYAAAVEIDYYGTVSVKEDVTAVASSGNEKEGSDAYGIKILDYAYGADEKTNYSVTAEAGGDVTAEGDAGAGIYITHEEDANPVSVVVGGTVSGPDAAIVIENRAEHFTVEDIDITLWAAEPDGDGNIAVVKDAGPDGETGEWVEAVDDDATAALLESINYIVKTGEGLSYNALSTKKGKSVTLFEDQYHTANEEEEIAITVTGSTSQILEGIFYNANKADTLKKVSELKRDENGRFLMAMQRAGGMLLGLKWHTVHTWGEYVSDKNATCEQDGTKTAHCTYAGCTATDTVTDEGSKLGHSFTEYVSDNNATCEQDGTKTAHCDREGCEKTDTVADEGSKLGHSFTKYVSDGNATCEQDGTKTAHCDREGCGKTDTVTDEGSALGHSFTDYVSDHNATCEQDGTKTAHCDREGCEKTDTVADEGSALGHSFTKYVSDGNATCEQDGTKTAHCDREGCTATDTVTDEGSKLEHTAGEPQTENMIEPTETSEGGFDTVIRCIACNEILDSQHTVIPKIEPTEPEKEPEQPVQPAAGPGLAVSPLHFEKAADDEAVQKQKEAVDGAAQAGNVLGAFPDDIKEKLVYTALKDCAAWQLKGDWDGVSAADVVFRAEGMNDGKAQMVLGFGDGWLALDAMEVKDGIMKITLQADQIKNLLSAGSVLIVILAE